MEEGTATGHVIAFDMTGVQLGHVARLGIMAIKNMLNYLQDAIPFRLKGLHFFNIVPFVDKIIFLMKPFMKKELWEVFHLHSTYETFYKFVNPEVLPVEYPSGEAESLNHYHNTTFQHLVELREYFLEEERTRRLGEKAGKKEKIDKSLQIEDKFRTLDID